MAQVDGLFPAGVVPDGLEHTVVSGVYVKITANGTVSMHVACHVGPGQYVFVRVRTGGNLCDGWKEHSEDFESIDVLGNSTWVCTVFKGRPSPWRYELTDRAVVSREDGTTLTLVSTEVTYFPGPRP